VNADAQPSAAARALGVPEPLPTPSSAAIMMATIRPLNISVNETDQSVWVDAGGCSQALIIMLPIKP
jgi:hypothetical protein